MKTSVQIASYYASEWFRYIDIHITFVYSIPHLILHLVWLRDGDRIESSGKHFEEFQFPNLSSTWWEFWVKEIQIRFSNMDFVTHFRCTKNFMPNAGSNMRSDNTPTASSFNVNVNQLIRIFLLFSNPKSTFFLCMNEYSLIHFMPAFHLLQKNANGTEIRMNNQCLKTVFCEHPKADPSIWAFRFLLFLDAVWFRNPQVMAPLPFNWITSKSITIWLPIKGSELEGGFLEGLFLLFTCLQENAVVTISIQLLSDSLTTHLVSRWENTMWTIHMCHRDLNQIKHAEMVKGSLINVVSYSFQMAAFPPGY